MTINYNTSNWFKGSYEKDALNFIGWFENPALMKNGANLSAHFEGTSIALGFGYDLIQNRDKAKDDLARVGVTITDAQIKLLNDAAKASTTRKKDIAAQLANGRVVLPDITAAENLFKNVREEIYEDRLNKYLNSGGFTGTLPQSRERVALLSLVYAGRLADRDTGVNRNNPARRTLTGIAQALEAGNRQEVWFWIRYRSNYASDPKVEARNKAGYTKRAYAESELFGVYDNRNSATSEEAQNVYKILEAHRHEIFNYERQWGMDPNAVDYNTPSNKIAAANADFALEEDYTVKTLVMELNPAKTALLADLRIQYASDPDILARLQDGAVTSTNIYLNPHKSTDDNRYSRLDAQPYETGIYAANGANDLMIGMDQVDDMFGGRGNDVLIGEAGEDYLAGGEGDDILVGGAGKDTYFYKSGDGNDRIIDTGENEIIIEDSEGNRRTITNVYKTGAEVWTTADGKVEINHHSPWEVVLEDGSTIVLGENLQDGAFGIRLLDIPDVPQTTHTITGDKDPQNLNDSLTDTAANDRIEGLSGDDNILAMSGNDWLLGGAGSDIITVSGTGGHAVIEGGSGSDILSGGGCSDLVFAENYGEMEALVAAGETEANINARGDLATGGGGNDFIYGSNAMDLLFGGDGHDLIVGGGGDDVIISDGSFAGATRDWTSTVITYEGDVWAHEHRMTGIGYVAGTNLGDDVIYAGTGNDFVNAGGGDDEVYAGDGNDVVFGYGGDDFIEGGEGNDILVGDEFNVPISEQGDDYIDGGAGNDLIRGDGGNDDLFGGAGNDVIYGDNQSYYVAHIGDDYLDGEAGNDTLYGGRGNDTLFGGDGNDGLQGDAGNDYLDGEQGDDILIGNDGDNVLYGGDGNDKLYGGSGNNEMYGGAGNDTINGDYLFGLIPPAIISARHIVISNGVRNPYPD